MKALIFFLSVGLMGCNSVGRDGNNGGGGNTGGMGGAGGAGGTAGGGGGGNGGSGGGTGGGTGGAGGCSDAAKLVYVIDQNNDLSSFAPNQTDVTKSTFMKIGTLNCPGVAAGLETPFSMGVDRSGTAWVEFTSIAGGYKLFKVSTTDASCTATSFMPGQQGFDEFGMGFVSDMPMSDQETLFIAGGALPGLGGPPATTSLGTLAFPSLTITKVPTQMQLAGSPELTGTGDAKLWGFFPDPTNPRVSQIDKTTGKEGTSYPLIKGNIDLSGTPAAWAFAFWGGDFWIFLQKNGEASSSVYHVKASDGSITQWTPTNPTRTIVGAGVSTCAPTIPIG